MTERACPRLCESLKCSGSPRAAAGVVLVAAITLLVAGCGGSSSKLFRSPYLSFRYPPSWQTRHYQDSSTLSTLIVYLSNQRLHQLCAVRHGTHNTTITCHQPIARLHPHSILAWWEQVGKPGWTFNQIPGPVVKVGTQHAKLQPAPGDCGVGATAGIEADVQIPGNSNGWDQFIACIRGPGTDHLEQQARALLNTVTFPHG